MHFLKFVLELLNLCVNSIFLNSEVPTMNLSVSHCLMLQREGSQGKLNSVSLLALHSGGSVSMEEAVKQIQRPIEKCRRELLKLVVSRGGAVPRPCRELFWSMCKVCHFFYSGGDGFSSPTAKAGAVDAVIHEPLNLSCSV